MSPIVYVLITSIASLIVTLAGSAGFWHYLQKKTEGKSYESQMLKGLGHDRVMELGLRYIARGWITSDEYENLEVYLYEPYEGLHGNGSAKKIMEEVRKLPIRNLDYSTLTKEAKNDFH